MDHLRHTLQQQVLEECHSALQVRSVSGGKQQASRRWAVATSEECIAVTVEGGPLLLYDFEVGSQPDEVTVLPFAANVWLSGRHAVPLRRSQAAFC